MPQTAVGLLLLHLITRISAQDQGCDGYFWATEDDGQGNVIMTIQKRTAHGLEVGDEVFLHGMRDESGAAMDAVARLYEGNHRVGNWTSPREENEKQFQVHDPNVPCTAANKCPLEGKDSSQQICVALGWRPSQPPSPPPTPAPPPSASPAPPPVQSESESADVGGIVGGVVGGCFVPVLMCALWLGGVFAKYGCPSPIKKQKADSGPQLTGTVYATGDRL